MALGPSLSWGQRLAVVLVGAVSVVAGSFMAEAPDAYADHGSIPATGWTFVAGQAPPIGASSYLAVRFRGPAGNHNYGAGNLAVRYWCSHHGTTGFQAAEGIYFSDIGAYQTGVQCSSLSGAPSTSTLVGFRVYGGGNQFAPIVLMSGTDPSYVPPKACDDGQITQDEVDDGWGDGGGGWGAPDAPGGGSYGGEDDWGFLFWLDQAEYRQWIEDEARRLGSGWSGTSPGGGGWGTGGSWYVACDQDQDGAPDVGPAPVAAPPPPPVAPDPEDEGCDANLLDPTSWLCGILGVLGRILDAIVGVLDLLRGLGAFLLSLVVPSPGFFESKGEQLRTGLDQTPVGPITDTAGGVVTAFDGFDKASTCQGPGIGWDVFHVGNGEAGTWHPIDACGHLSGVASWVRLLLMLSLWLGALLAGLNIVAGAFGISLPWDGSSAD